MYSMAEEKRNLTSDAHRNDWILKLTLSNFNLTKFISEENEFALKQTEMRVKAFRGGGVLHD